MHIWLIILLVEMLLMSLSTLVLYAWDKRQARRQGWRVAEKYLHLLSLLGGWPGAWAGQRWFRHKTIKPGFRWVFYATVVAHLCVVGAGTYVVWLVSVSR